jgi:hypothetical protein
MERAMKDKDTKTTDREKLKHQNREQDGAALRHEIEQRKEEREKYKIMEYAMKFWLKAATGEELQLFARTILLAWGIETDEFPVVFEHALKEGHPPPGGEFTRRAWPEPAFSKAEQAHFVREFYRWLWPDEVRGEGFRESWPTI